MTASPSASEFAPAAAAAVRARPQFLLLLAPLLFAAHIAEEAPGLFSAGYVSWFNSFVSPRLGESNFWRANLTPFLITLLLAALTVWIGRLWMAYVLLVWLSHFVLANALFHIIATLAMLRYSPGLVTSVTLYLPFFLWFVWYLHRRHRASREIILLISALAGFPMYLQIYMVVFRHSRFF
jgi:hypothetical protein